MAGQKLLFLGTLVHSKTRDTLEIMHEAAVGVESGKMVAMQQGPGAREQLLARLEWQAGEFEEQRSGKLQFFFPGFVDTHTHASQYANCGIFGKSTLLDWLTTYTFPMEESLDDRRKARRVYEACVGRMVAHGTTTGTYFATAGVGATNELVDVCLEMGQRAFVGRVCMDCVGVGEGGKKKYGDESVEEGLGRTRETVEYVKARDPGFDLVCPIMTPRFAPSCSMEVMKGLARMSAEEGVPIQTHVSENEAEMAVVRAKFPSSGSYAGVYDESGLLTSRTILAHAVHLSDWEARLIASRGSKVSHCPCSNASLSSGGARVRWLWDRGVDVGLGTDVSGGYSASILDAARQAVVNSRGVARAAVGGGDEDKLSVEEALYLATRGGARVVGLQDRIGGFDVGMDWDAQLVSFEAGNVDVFGWETWEEMLAKWLFCGDDRNTKRVWVKGRLIHSKP